jgi:cysteine desulfurase family protein (TIGR01976 family)
VAEAGRARVTAAAPLDLAAVRAQFPALAGDTVFFDNAGGSQTLARVVDRIADYLITSNVQLGASYARSRLSSERVAASQAALARLINAADPAEIVLGASATQLLFNLAEAFGGTLRAGDRIVVTDADHAANIGAWQRLARLGVGIDVWRIDHASLQLRLADLDRVMTDRTRLVCFTHCSNVLGTIHPAAEMVRHIHARGAEVCIDGVAFAPHRRIDVQAIDADYYVLSLYKVFGPHIGLLHAKRAALAALPRLNHDCVAADDIPYKQQPGNANYELAWGAAGAVDYLDELGQGAADPIAAAFERIAQHEEVLAARLLGYLGTRRDARVIGLSDADRSRRVATVSFVVVGRDSSSIPPHADARGIGIRWGDFYSRDLVDALGLRAANGVVRVSIAHYNTVEEVDRLIAVLDEALAT